MFWNMKSISYNAWGIFFSLLHLMISFFFSHSLLLFEATINFVYISYLQYSPRVNCILYFFYTKLAFKQSKFEYFYSLFSKQNENESREREKSKIFIMTLTCLLCLPIELSFLIKSSLHSFFIYSFLSFPKRVGVEGRMLRWTWEVKERTRSAKRSLGFWNVSFSIIWNTLKNEIAKNIIKSEANDWDQKNILFHFRCVSMFQYF